MRVVVLGAGYAGVTVARRLDARLPPEVELVVVDERPTHLVQHELHRLVRYPELEDVIQVPLAELFDRAEVRTARVDSVDRDARVVRFEGGDELAYDYVAVCLGAETAFYDLPGLEANAIPLKRPEDARAIRESFLETCRDGGTAVVGGAGLSGVQVAGELAALADEEGSGASVVLLEQLDAVAPSFPENFQRAVRDELETRGVDVRTGTTVERATVDEVETDAGSIPYGTLVWTGGIRGPDAMGCERPVVRSDLRLDERTFVVGDAGRIVDADGEAVPASASAALREARTVADNLLRLVEHDQKAAPDEFAPRLQQYRFEVPGWIVSVGDGTVAQVGPTVLRGGAARAMKATVGAGHLSSIGAVQQAADLVEAELGPRELAAHRETVESALDEVGVDPAEVVDGDPDGRARDRHGDRESDADPAEPIEIEIEIADPIDEGPIDEEPDPTDSTTDSGRVDRGDDATGDHGDVAGNHDDTAGDHESAGDGHESAGDGHEDTTGDTRDE